LDRNNIMVGVEQARLIDWAHPGRAVGRHHVRRHLIVAGHHPAGAEAWCEQSPAYRAASPAAATAFTDAVRAMWQ
jgi:hypothetical protein